MTASRRLTVMCLQLTCSSDWRTAMTAPCKSWNASVAERLPMMQQRVHMRMPCYSAAGAEGCAALGVTCEAQVVVA